MRTDRFRPWLGALGFFLGEVCSTLCCAQGPMAVIEDVSLNPTNFAVTVRITNSVPHHVYTLMAYDGPPAGWGPGVVREKVSDCVEATTDTLLLVDQSSPLGEAGRTYVVAIFGDVETCSGDLTFYPIVYSRDEVYAPYPFFSNVVISASSITTNESGPIHRIEYGEGLYSNVFLSPVDTNRTGFYRLAGSNNIPTNAFVEKSVNGSDWIPAPAH